MQIVLLSTGNREFAATGRDVVRLFYPEARIHLEYVDNHELTLVVSVSKRNRSLNGKAEIKNGQTVLEEKASIKCIDIPEPGDEVNQQKRLIRLALFRLLTRYTGKQPGPWGILTGIRPTKIVHRLKDLGWTDQAIEDYLVKNYDMSHEKAHLLTGIAERQRKYLLDQTEAAKTVSIYVGIPFCPTRCAYCSFPSYALGAHGSLLDPFLDTLKKEVTAVGSALREMGKTVQTIYIGGGTPTVLDRPRLSALLKFIRDYLVSQSTVEITLEAGRPDTISKEKLKTAREYGITRLSINPQSMSGQTLQVIGRRHSPQEVLESVSLARQMGFENINMDIIIGLPGESVSDVEHTLEMISGISPENLTVHTLAVKRASKIREARDNFRLPGPLEVEQMLKVTAEAAAGMGMHSYYLYRQKMMVSPLENTGYAREGFDCIYNIQIIEERQTIIGLGGGAGSKFLEPGTWYLTSQSNPKDPETYIKRIDQLIAGKVDKLHSFG
ncbi:MAG: coproporphyrinogen dehydrogenase HemZ [Firmicutes bacterium HGW-Firmicutes-14]|jgi:oxygen-independent coproporphyrinogen-3 oxidase|nr:MAG: coproporphyrinogen dehydrogenase HemZ [Firmicutes bacterium HGW-Firmicutes-14]